jgi:hypothetical protein
MALRERPTSPTPLEENAPVWVAWRCVCGAFLVSYDARYPCMLSKRCVKCKRECTLDRRGVL